MALPACLGLCLLAQAEPRNPSTDWMSGQYGLGFHYLRGNIKGGTSDWNATVQMFDAKKFADDVEKTGAKWVLFTLGQNSGYYCAPNPVIDSVTGYKPGERNSLRDLPMDIMNELTPRGIRVMLYLPSSIPNSDGRYATTFGLSAKEPGGGNYMINEPFMHKWAKVIQYWSEHYGDKLSGWWFDGFYRRVGFNNDLGKIYEDAVKAGNPKSVLSLCGGIRDKEELRVHSNHSDYLCGEQNNFAENTLPFTTRWYTGTDSLGPVQWQTFCQFTPGWWTEGNRYQDDPYVAYANATMKKGGAITWNAFLYGSGVMAPGVLDQFVRTRSRIVTNPLPTSLAPKAPDRSAGARWKTTLFPSGTGVRFDLSGRTLPVTGVSAAKLYIVTTPR